MITNQVIILPLFLPEGFPNDFEKKTAIFLSKKNKVILFRPHEGTTLFKLLTSKQKFNHFKKQLKTFKNPLIYFPIINFLPYQRFSYIRNLNYRIALRKIALFTKIIGKKPILWLFYPQFENLIGKFNEKLVIYDCLDYHSSIDPTQDKFKKEKEAKLLKKTDIVFTNSPVLYRLKKNLHPKVFQVPQSCHANLFLKRKKQPIPEDLKKIPSPRIGFVGNINHRLNFELIKTLSLNNSRFSFVFVGPQWGDPRQDKIINFEKKIKELKKIKNIYFLGAKSKKQLIGYIDNFDLGIIPYNINYEFCRFCYPLKVFEFFCRGKSLVSTPIESLKLLTPLIKIAKNAKEFEKEIKKILKNGWPRKYIERQKKLALVNSWEAKIKKISQILKKFSSEKT